MLYLNPFSILRIEINPFNSFDVKSIQKNKRRLLAEIELDGFIVVDGLEVNKTDALTAFEDLDNVQKRDFHFFLYQNRYLSEFLTFGNTKFFFNNYSDTSLLNNKSVERINLHNNTRTENNHSSEYFNNRDFVDFISPYYTEKFNQVFSKAVISNNLKEITFLAASPIKLDGANADKSFKDAYRYLKEKIQEIDKITEDVETEGYFHENPENINSRLKELTNIELLNRLPNYFQNTRNDFTSKIRNLSITIHNQLEETEIAQSILKFASSIEVDGLIKKRVSEDLKRLEDLVEEQLAQKAEAEKIREVLDKTVLLLKEIERFNGIMSRVSGDATLTGLSEYSLITKVKTQVSRLLNVSEINNLPDQIDFVPNLRNNVAINLRNISILIFNCFDGNEKVAEWLLGEAEKIRTSADVRNRLKKDRADLTNRQAIYNAQVQNRSLETQQANVLTVTQAAYSSAPNQNLSNSEVFKNWFLVIALGIIAVLICSFCNIANKNSVSNNNASANSLMNVQTANQQNLNSNSNQKYGNANKSSQRKPRSSQSNF